MRVAVAGSDGITLPTRSRLLSSTEIPKLGPDRGTEPAMPPRGLPDGTRPLRHPTVLSGMPFSDHDGMAVVVFCSVAVRAAAWLADRRR